MDVDSTQTIALGQQLAAAGGMTVLMVIVHVLGLVGISKLLSLDEEHLKRLDFGMRSIMRMSALGIALLFLHTFEIALFAGFYLAVGAVETFEEALYFSASAYATLGRTAEYFPSAWRLMGAFEALIGFLMIGWSTAFIVSKSDKMTPG